MLESRSPVQVAIVLTVLHFSKTSIHLVGVLSVGKHHSSLCGGRTHESSSVKRDCPTDSLIRHYQPHYTQLPLLSLPLSTTSVQAVQGQCFCRLPDLTLLHQTVEIHLLLDSGSQRSYLSERTRKMMELEPVEPRSSSCRLQHLNQQKNAPGPVLLLR